MIITLKDTIGHEIASRIVSLREGRGAATLGRVLTLITVVPNLIDADRTIEISDATSREHPCRAIVVIDSSGTEGAARLNTWIRVGDAAGPSDVIVPEPKGQVASALDTLVTPLPLSDTPVATYWPVAAPHNPGEHLFGRIAIHRITDSRGSRCPLKTLLGLSQHYTPGDMDLGWAGVTLWRALLATIAVELNQMSVSVPVKGHETYPSSYLVAVWIHRTLGVPVTRQTDPHVSTIIGAHFYFAHGSQVSLRRRASSNVVHLHRSGLATADVSLLKRSVQDCLMEELRRLDPDVLYGELLTGDPYLLSEVAKQITQ